MSSAHASNALEVAATGGRIEQTGFDLLVQADEEHLNESDAEQVDVTCR
jgi:hypothetical protein